MPGDPWTVREKNVLWHFFESEGADGCMARMKKLEARGAGAIKMMARKMRLQNPRLSQSLMRMLTDEQVEEVIRLHDVERIGFKKIGERYGIAEATTSNAYWKGMCARRGYRPAERNENGHLLPAEIDRLRTFLRKGTKPVEIQLYMGISAGAICNERRQYNAELKSRGKRLLPPPGNGERYSGSRISNELKKEVERLYLAGHATPKVSELTGVSYTHCLRIREKIVKRLRRKGECLAGCDLNGVRRSYPTTILRIPEESKAHLRQLLLDRIPVRRAAKIAGIGSCMAYRIRDALKAELDARGEQLPPPILPGSGPEARRLRAESEWLPKGRPALIRYRRLLAEHGAKEARRLMLAEAAAADAERRRQREEERQRPLTFEEQLERVRNGAGLVDAFNPSRATPDITLGGIASAQI